VLRLDTLGKPTELGAGEDPNVMLVLTVHRQ
jgi:hypothetical protein